MKLPKGLRKLSEVCCHKCHLTLRGIFILCSLPNFTLGAHYCHLPQPAQLWLSSWKPEIFSLSICMSHPQTCVCLALYFNPVTTAWHLVLSRDQLCCFSSQDFIPFALFPHPKINSYLSLLCSKYFKRVIHAEEEPKWRKLLKCRSSSKWRMKGKERGEKREQETCSEIFLLPPNFFSSGACINPVSATAGNKVTPKTEAYTVPRE